MRVGVDYSSVFQAKTGIGTAAQNLLEAMKKEAPETEFLLYRGPGRDLRTPSRIFWESVRLPLTARKDKLDILYSPGFAPPLWSPAPSVVTVHDLIGMAFPGNQGAVSSFYWSRWLPMALKRARRLVTSSEHTRKDIEKFLKIPADRVSVAPLGVDSAFRKIEDAGAIQATIKKYDLRPPFYICVGTLEPRKNHLRLLQAYAQLKRQKKNAFSLVIVGKVGAASEELRRYAMENNLEPEVRFLGYLNQEELICLYNAALGYVMISLYEGFGLPVLEAMSCGLSGVCSNRSSLPEVAGDTALMVDPENVDEIAEAMSVFWEDPARRNKLTQAARQRAGRFSMNQCAKQMMRVFRDEAQK